MSQVVPIVALDVPTSAEALQLVDDLGELCRVYKVGSELFASEGPDIVRALRSRGAQVFLDLKFHDIPNTVRGAARAAARLGARLLTVHASGGRAMLQASVEGAREGARDGKCDVLAVSVLTSLDGASLGEAWGRPVGDVEREVLRLAQLASEAGLHGVVCGGREAAAVRSRFGPHLATLVPGVRLVGDEHQDQARVVTPREAKAAGARYIVVGRTVTASPSSRNAMRAVLADLS